MKLLTRTTPHIADVQRADHERLDRLLTEYENDGESDRAATYQSIVTLVTTHAFAEESVLFPAARRLIKTGEITTGDIEGKHQRINELMLEMHAAKPGEPSFEARRAELFPLLRADVREEEDVLLAALARSTDEWQLRAIGAAWSAAKVIAPNRPHPNIPRRPPGNVLAAVPLTVSDHIRRAVAWGPVRAQRSGSDKGSAGEPTI